MAGQGWLEGPGDGVDRMTGAMAEENPNSMRMDRI